jgi:hypothetical protein
MAPHAAPAGADLLQEVERLADEEYDKGAIAERLGFRNPTTFDGRLVKASQQSGKSVPVFRAGSKATARKRVDIVQVKPRGRGNSFGVNVPQEPLERLGAKPGDTLSVNVSRRRIVLAVASAGESMAAPAPPGPWHAHPSASMARSTRRLAASSEPSDTLST